MSNANIIDSPNTLNGPHGRIHKGQFFIAHEVGVLGNGASIDYLFQTGSLEPHFSFQGDALGNLLIELFKQVTFSAAGTPLTPLNVKDPATTLPTISVSSGATLSSTGTTWESIIIPGGSGGNAMGGSGGARIEEFILNPTDLYAIRLTNLTTTNNDYAIQFGWYEEVE